MRLIAVGMMIVRKRRLGQTGIYIIVISAFLIAVNAALGFALIRQSSAAIRSMIESRMLDVSNTAAAMLDGDTLERLEAGDKGTPEYQSVLNMLTCFKENIGLEYIYCVREMGDGEFAFTVDSDIEAPGEFGQHIPYTEALHQASLGTASVDKEPYADSWGRFYSAYSPVYDSARRIAGIVAVDFSAEWYEQQINHLIRTTVVFVGTSFLFAVAIIWLIITRYRRRFDAMFHEMNQISDGIETLVAEASPSARVVSFEADQTAPSGDPIAQLGAKIHSLEAKLGEQIAIIHSQAYIDGLTKLGNRAAYGEHVAHIDEQIKQGTAGFAIIVFDLNGLKEINDRYGHEKGDETIVEAAAVLRQAFNEGRLYRVGGDEFVVILEGENTKTRSWLEETFGDRDVISFSKGYAVFDPEVDTSYSTVFNRADNDMYDDKKEYYTTHEDRRRRS